MALTWAHRTDMDWVFVFEMWEPQMIVDSVALMDTYVVLQMDTLWVSEMQ